MYICTVYIYIHHPWLGARHRYHWKAACAPQSYRYIVHDLRREMSHSRQREPQIHFRASVDPSLLAPNRQQKQMRGRASCNEIINCNVQYTHNNILSPAPPLSASLPSASLPSASASASLPFPPPAATEKLYGLQLRVSNICDISHPAPPPPATTQAASPAQKK